MVRNRGSETQELSFAARSMRGVGGAGGRLLEASARLCPTNQAKTCLSGASYLNRMWAVHFHSTSARAYLLCPSASHRVQDLADS